MAARRLSILALLIVATTVAQAQVVDGEVVAAGFAAGGSTIFKGGQWLPIRVKLTPQGSDVFSGSLRVECLDLDGDRVAFTQPRATVAPGVASKEIWCYAQVNDILEVPEHVDVVSDAGILIARLPMPAQPCEMINNDDLLVLDISDQGIPGLRNLITAPWNPGDRGNGVRPYYRNVVVSTLAAANLPDRWWGLESVDVIFWDLPQPNQLSIAQRDALVAWVRNGGQLIVGVGANWPQLAACELAPLLPLSGAGPTVELDRVSLFLGRYGERGASARKLARPLPATTAQLTPGALRIMGEYGPGNATINLLALHTVDSGRVSASAASIRELLTLRLHEPQAPESSGEPVLINKERFFTDLLDLNRLTSRFKENELNKLSGIFLPDNLYDDVVQPISFRRTSAVGSLTAFLFVAAYIAAATVGTWWWLRRRNQTQLSWTVFAVFAVVASAFSLFTVSGMRTLFSRGVQTLSILDLRATSVQARGPVLFGYASPIRRRVELTLPDDGSFLRPLARNPIRKNYYLTPARYSADAPRAQLDDVLMRATLKQFESYWQGQLDGTIRGRLIADRATGQLTPDSWLINDTGLNLAGGILLFIDPRHEQVGVPARAVNLNTLYDQPDEPARVPPAVNILALNLPGIDTGQRAINIGTAQYQRIRREQDQWRARKGKRRDMPDLSTLHDMQHEWAGLTLRPTIFRALSPDIRALLLASTRNFFLHCTTSDYDSAAREITTDGLPEMDITHWLLGGSQTGQAVLLCWAHQPGPATLMRGDVPLTASDGLTLLRVRLPIEYTGRPRSPGSNP